MTYICEKCGDVAIAKMRYCKDCKKVVLKELYDCGYLKPHYHMPKQGDTRTQSQKENRYETVYGVDSTARSNH